MPCHQKMLAYTETLVLVCSGRDLCSRPTVAAAAAFYEKS